MGAVCRAKGTLKTIEEFKGMDVDAIKKAADDWKQKALVEVNYTGVCSLEYESDFNDNLLPVVECIAYERGICDTLGK